MLKTRKRWISLLVAVVMVAALLVPFVGTASASTSYSITNVATVTSPSVATAGNSGTWTNIGSLVVTMDPATAASITAEPETAAGVNASNASLFIQMPTSPSGYGLTATQGNVAVAPVANTIVAATVGEIGGSASTYQVWVTFPASANEIEITFPNPVNLLSGSSSSSIQFSIPLAVEVPGGVTGSVTATASAPGSSLLTSGSLVIASVGVSGLTLAVASTTAISSSGNQALGTIEITENAAGSLNYYNAGGTPLKLTLPPGFSWVLPGVQNLQFMWGDDNLLTENGLTQTVMGVSRVVYGLENDNNVSISNDNRELDISSTYASQSATYFQLTPSVSVNEALAQTGNITVAVGGSATSNVSSVVVGTYGQYGAAIKAQSAPTIGAGQTGDTIGELEVTEGIPGSILGGRTLTLTLPSGAEWAEAPTLDTSLSTNYGTLNSFYAQSIDTNANLLQITWNTGATTLGQSSAASLFFKNMEVSTAVDFSGPLTVTVGGSEGLTGTVTLAQVQPVITAAAASSPNVLIGQASQALGDMTITEGAAGDIAADTNYSGIDINGGDEYGSSSGVIESGGYGFVQSVTENNEPNLYIVAPAGITFDTTPTVTVTSGNMQLGSVTTETSDAYLDVVNQGVVVIPIQASSTTASTITLSGIQVTIDNTVPEGPVTFKVEGPAINQETLPPNSGSINALPSSDLAACFPNDTVAATTTAGTVTNGVASTNSAANNVVFTIGSTNYTLNGTSVSTDVAPYIMDSRTFVPLRAVANALGVQNSGIIWDPTSDKVTIIKGSLVAQFTIGSTMMLLNGAAITMDTAPAITDGRTCLPIAWAAQALGVTYTWDATAQTVTFGAPITSPTTGVHTAPSGGATTTTTPATTTPTTTTTTPTTTPTTTTTTP